MTDTHSVKKICFLVFNTSEIKNKYLDFSAYPMNLFCPAIGGWKVSNKACDSHRTDILKK